MGPERPIPDPGVKKAPDPGSGSATLVLDRINSGLSKLLFVLQAGSMVGSSRDRTREFADTVRSLQGRTANGHAVFRPVSSTYLTEMLFLEKDSNRKFFLC